MFSKILKASYHRLLHPQYPAFRFSAKKNLNFRTPEQIKLKKEQQQKKSAYLNIALACFVFGLCFAGIPIYRTFCEHLGLIGDADKKEYTFTDKKINNLKKFKVSFTGYTDPKIDWEFEPIERELVVSAGQTAIVFYRLYNKQDRAIVGFATYNISPEDCNLYFSKIQCFCFNQQLINPKEELLLPIFFYLQPEINDDDMVSRIKEIKVAYTFTKSAKQDLAKFAAEEEKRIQENKRKLNQIRAKKLNMTLDQYKNHLEEKQRIQEAENQKLKQESQRKRRQLQLAELKRQQSFEEDLLKAELISKEIEEQFFSSQAKTKII